MGQSARGGHPSTEADPASHPLKGKEDTYGAIPSPGGPRGGHLWGSPPRPEELGQPVSEPLPPLPPGSPLDDYPGAAYDGGTQKKMQAPEGKRMSPSWRLLAEERLSR